MLDPKLLRTNLDTIVEQLRIKKFDFDTKLFNSLEQQRKSLQVNTQQLQSESNIKSREIGKAKAKGTDIQPLLDEVADLGKRLKHAETDLDELLNEVEELLLGIPNVPDATVPAGDSEDDNCEVLVWGEKPEFDFEIKDHIELGVGLNGMDFERAAKLSGSRFVSMTGPLVTLHRILTQFMINQHSLKHGYTEVYVPYLVNEATLTGTGQLPKFKQDLFHVESESHDLYLIPTAEVPVTNLAADQIFAAADLPIKYTAQTPCFRREAGSAGQDTRGMIRQHQFSKVEMVSITTQDQSLDELERMTGCAEEVLKRLELPHQTVILCIGDMGFGARKTYDIEVWLPGQGRYREIPSCSNCGDFPARRMKARFRIKGEKQTRFVHTLNGSALAVGRTLIAILENGQQADGSVAVPEALRPYMGGLERIAPGVGPDAG